MVFVGCKHPIYTAADRKTPKRVGNLVKSSSASLHDMLMTHKEEVQKFIKGQVKSTGAESPMEEVLPVALKESDFTIQHPVDYLAHARQQQAYLDSIGVIRY